MIKSINIHFFILNVIICTFYFFIFFNLNAKVNYEVMFSTTDSNSYLAIIEWIFNGKSTDYTEIRPVLYPLIISIPYKIFGSTGIWLVQFLFWVGSINFCFFSIKDLTNKPIYAYLTAFVITTNLSYIGITLHALTEVTTMFLLSILVYFILRYRERFRTLFFVHGIILILILLTLVKPVFYIPLLLILFVALPIFHLKKYIIAPKKVLQLIIILFPLFIQLTIMQVKHDSFTVSNISSKTLTNYFLAQGIEGIEGVSRNESIDFANSFSTQEKLNYLYENKEKYYSNYIINMEDRGQKYPTYLNHPIEYAHKVYSDFMIELNHKYSKIHDYFIFPQLFFLVFFFIKKDYMNLILLLILVFSNTYLLLVTGVSFWQGDRLILPTIIIWATMYSYLLYWIITLLGSSSFKESGKLLFKKLKEMKN